MTSYPKDMPSAPLQLSTARSHSALTLELLLWGLIIALCNAPMLLGTVSHDLMFSDTSSLVSWIAHPLVHASPYHLLLDAGAFISLYAMLAHIRRFHRLGVIILCGAASLASVLVSNALTDVTGFCGLSGIAHGLMAFVTLDMAARTSDRIERLAGTVGFILLVAKSILEALSGHVVFDFIHLGSVGTPLTVCHAGGALGGIIGYLIHSTRLHLRAIRHSTC